MNETPTAPAKPPQTPEQPTPPSAASTSASPRDDTSSEPISGRVAEEQEAVKFSRTSGFPYFDTRELGTDFNSISDLLDVTTMREYKVVPLHEYSEHSLELGITNDTDRSKLPELQSKFPKIQLTFKAVSRSGYNFILNRTYYLMFAAERNGDFLRFGQKLSEAAPKQAFQYIAQLAYWLGASDIHIEPGAEGARIRFRLDGVLHPITTVATAAYEIFLSDLQTRAEIKWGSSEPQSGRISYSLMSHQSKIVQVNMRIETIPTFHGEEIVVRIFNDETRNLSLPEMGFSESQVERLEAVIAHPNGLVLTVGPTGSGKTSTLYSIINKLNTPETKIVTLEDPVEYNMPGISQVPVHTEDTESFATKLRAVMREDPNVVMIGEIRDIDTAKTALQAALTGHLVLSTFHATDATAAISRMLDMIGHNPLFASAVRMIVAQRLARQVCKHCHEAVSPTNVQLAYITDVVKNIPEDRRPVIDTSKETKLKLQRGKGCPECHGIGYKGRIGIIELLAITPDIEKMMTDVNKTTAQELAAKAVKNGMVTMVEDGLNKALAGITTIDEIMALFEPTAA